MLTKEEVNNWLSSYGNAWESGDFESVTSLFSEDAVYHEDWKDGASDSQENVSFQYVLWTIDDDQCFAHWCATFTRINSQERVKLDGVFRLKLQRSESDVPVCTSLQEWWHQRHGLW